MASTDYHIVTEWTVDGGVEEIAAVFHDGEGWARWWPATFLSVTELHPERELTGRAVAVHSKGWLPYTLRLRAEVLDCEYPHRCTIGVSGDFEGIARCSLEAMGKQVVVRFDWRLRVAKPVLRRFSWVLKPLFRGNHKWAMRRGRESLVLELARRRAQGLPHAVATGPPPPPTFPYGWGLPGRSSARWVWHALLRAVPRHARPLCLVVALASLPTAAVTGHSAKQPAGRQITTEVHKTADGADLRYVATGSGPRTIVFLHGWSGQPADWEAQRVDFANDYRVLIPDLRPLTGVAGQHHAWSVEHLGAEITSWLDSLAADRVVLVAHELGGLVGAEAAARLGPRVIALVGVETFVHTRNPVSRAQQRSILAGLRSDFMGTMADLAAMELGADDHKLLPRIVANAERLEPDAAIVLLESAFGYDLGARLVAVAGRVATVNSPHNEPIVSALRSVDPDFEVLLTGDWGPLPFIEHAAEFNDLIRGFLDPSQDARP